MDNHNRAAALASKFVNSTSRHIFLTGKAGTGKTTFLQQISKRTHKNTVIAAPTGIAAINAGGVTLHSLFQLPFGAFIPSNRIPAFDSASSALNTPHALLKKLKMNSHKRALIRSIELLIIDEVSMLRADLLDAIDTILRTVRRRQQTPFGGVQMLFIGDLQQLPPVVRDHERTYLRSFYSTLFFFEAHALRQNQPLYIELEKIYRQNDPDFISILNHLRNNQQTRADVETLNRHYKPGFKPNPEQGYVYLTTHNAKADNTNRSELQKLETPSFFYDAQISGKFDENIYPVEPRLELKVGAQVMFIKNDPSGQQQFFNGKIGKVLELEKDQIQVGFTDDSEPVLVGRYTWENVRFTLNKATNEVEEKVVGTFVQYPLKLAWAITVHKSQGLTFEKAIIDVSQAFAPGQVYVALSRLTSLNGLVLTAPFQLEGIDQPRALEEFNSSKPSHDKLQSSFKTDSRNYLRQMVLEAFNFNGIKQQLLYHYRSYSKDEKRSAKQKYVGWAKEIESDFAPVSQTGNKFLRQLNGIFSRKEENYLHTLRERVQAAKDYFEPLLKDFSDRANKQILKMNKEKGVKQYISELREVDLLFFGQLKKIYKARALIQATIDETELTRENTPAPGFSPQRAKHAEKIAKTKDKKPPKPDTKKVSLELYRGGKKVAEIAKERSLTERTIEKHLAFWVRQGEIDATEIVPKERIETILQTAKELDTSLLTPIKNQLGDDYSYSELHFAMAHKEHIEKE